MINIIIAFLFFIFFTSCQKEQLENTNQLDLKHHPFIMAKDGHPLVVAHRGGSRLAPENTLLAFDEAVRLGVDILEMDVCLTKDNELVTIHDIEIDRTSDGKGLVSDYTYDELLQFNFGVKYKNDRGENPYLNQHVPIPKLEEIFQRYPNHLMMIEIKESAKGALAAEKLHDLIFQYNMEDKVLVFCAFDNIIVHYRNLSTQKKYTGAATFEMIQALSDTKSGINKKVNIKADAIAAPNYSFLTEKYFVDGLHRNQIGLFYWTVNLKNEMEELIRIGADGIITDRPDLLIETLKKMGKR